MSLEVRLQCDQLISVAGAVGIETRDDTMGIIDSCETRHRFVHANLACQTDARMPCRQTRPVQRLNSETGVLMFRPPYMNTFHHRLVAAAQLFVITLGGVPNQHHLHSAARRPASAQALQCSRQIGLVITRNDNDDAQLGMHRRVRQCNAPLLLSQIGAQ